MLPHISEPIAIHWFRRDLRLEDNAALYHALQSGLNVVPIFIFDSDILNGLENKKDARVHFIHNQLENLKNTLKSFDSDILILKGKPIDCWNEIFEKINVVKVFTNKDYEPYAIRRDQKVKDLCLQNGSEFNSYKDQVVFEHGEVLKPDGGTYTVFTPYMKKWRQVLAENPITEYKTKKHLQNFHKWKAISSISLENIGFKTSEINFPTLNVADSLITNYADTRDFPWMDACTHLSVHLRFGTISIRQLTRRALGLSDKFTGELVWREFYMQILAAFPHVVKSAFKPEYDRIEWRNNEQEFEKWCKGETGFPIIDAGMRELNETGYMHNRTRMAVASFLCKDLLIDYKWGEAYFAEKLLDFELASNNGGWQWAAGSGVDAAPYFRVFNPTLQQERFDPKGVYIKKWVPEFGTFDYVKPMLDHQAAKQRCMEVYKRALGSI